MLIELNNCGKSYNRQWLFRNVNCQLKTGEKWAFLGPNGSGKSTLSLMLAAQVWPTEGNIHWQTETGKMDAHKVFSQIALASPAMELPEEFSLTEIIEMHTRAKPFAVENPLQTMASLCGFDQKTLKKSVGNFSSGMKQRVKLCLAAFSKTPVLLLDEPLTNLDTAGNKVFEKIIDSYTHDRLLVIASNREDEYYACNKYIKIEPGGSVIVH